MFGWRPVRSAEPVSSTGYVQLVDLKDGNWAGSALMNSRPATTEEKCARALEELQQGAVRIGFAITRDDDRQAIDRVRTLIEAADPAVTERLFVEFDARNTLIENTDYLGSLMGMLRAGASLVARNPGGDLASAKALAVLEVAAIKVAPFAPRSGEYTTLSREALAEMHRQARIFAPTVIATHLDNPFQVELARRAGFSFVQGDAVASVSISRPWRILGGVQSNLHQHVH